MMHYNFSSYFLIFYSFFFINSPTPLFMYIMFNTICHTLLACTLHHVTRENISSFIASNSLLSTMYSLYATFGEINSIIIYFRLHLSNKVDVR